MTRDDSSLTAGTVQRRSPDDRPRRAPGSTVGRAGPRILIRLPDLRQPTKRRGWTRWFGFLAALMGGSGLAAAGHVSGKRALPSDPTDLSDPANVARAWSIFQKFRPLLRYVLAHPKTVLSGAVAAAAQFAAMVAWHESGATPDPSASVPAVTHTEPTTAPHPTAADSDQAPPWHGPALGTTQWPTSAPGTTGKQAQYPPAVPTASPYGQVPSSAGTNSFDHRRPTHVAARPLTDSTPLSTGRPRYGYAWLEGNIIPAPTRESQHEPQSSVH